MGAFRECKKPELLLLSRSYGLLKSSQGQTSHSNGALDMIRKEIDK